MNSPQQTRTWWRQYVLWTVFSIPLVLVLTVVVAVLVSPMVLWLWNWLMPSLFGVRQISWQEAIGVLLLGRLLFSNIGR